MAFTFGFYNAKQGDRKYNAFQMGELFDCVLTDGVMPNYGQLFAVGTANNGMQITVGTGKAWFNHTWSKNDSIMILTVPNSDVTRPRIDCVVLEINANTNIRANSIKIVEGVPSQSPSVPILVNTTDIHQYPLAYINVAKGITTIKASNIENRVGLSPTVFATGILQTGSLDGLWGQWRGEFEEWFAGVKEILGDDIGSSLTDLINQKVNISDKATIEEALEGTSNTKWMTPATLKAVIDPIRYTLYVDNFGYRVKVTAVLSYIGYGSWKINGYTGQDEAAIFLLKDTVIQYLYYYQSNTSNTFDYYFSIGTGRYPINSNASLSVDTSKSYGIVITSTAYSGTGTPRFYSRGIKELFGIGANGNDIGLFGYDAGGTDNGGEYYAILDMTKKDYVVINSAVHVTKSLNDVYNVRPFKTQGFIGVLYIYRTSSVRMSCCAIGSHLTGNPFEISAASSSSVDKENLVNNFSIGYGNSMYSIIGSSVNKSTYSVYIHRLTINSGSSATYTENVATTTIMNNQNSYSDMQQTILFKDDSYIYSLVGDHVVPLKFSVKDEQYVNADIVNASSTVAGISRGTTSYYGYQNGIHYFRNDDSGIVFTLSYGFGNASAITIHSSYTINIECNFNNILYKNEWRNGYFVIPGNVYKIADLYGNVYDYSSNANGYIVATDIGQDFPLAIRNDGTVYESEKAEFDLMTDGKKA